MDMFYWDAILDHIFCRLGRRIACPTLDLDAYIRTSLLDNRPVALADFAPAAVQLAALPTAFAAAAEGILRRQLLVDLYSPAWGLVRIQVAVLHHGAAFENFLRCLV